MQLGTACLGRGRHPRRAPVIVLSRDDVKASHRLVCWQSHLLKNGSSLAGTVRENWCATRSVVQHVRYSISALAIGPARCSLLLSNPTCCDTARVLEPPGAIMPRFCPGTSDAACCFSTGSARAPAQPTGYTRCAFCDLDRLETLLALPAGKKQIIRMLRATWLHAVNI